MDSSTYLGALEKAKPGNGTSLLPYINYKNHMKAMDNIKSTTDMGSPEQKNLHDTKRLRHELSSIIHRNRE